MQVVIRLKTLSPRELRRAALCLGLVMGTLMGGYQMVRGSHFMSHTLVTLVLVWWVSRRSGWLWGLEPRPR
jgi:membrane-associated PAP2 superfamily phosphatase